MKIPPIGINFSVFQKGELGFPNPKGLPYAGDRRVGNEKLVVVIELEREGEVVVGERGQSVISVMRERVWKDA